DRGVPLLAGGRARPLGEHAGRLSARPGCVFRLPERARRAHRTSERPRGRGVRRLPPGGGTSAGIGGARPGGGPLAAPVPRRREWFGERPDRRRGFSTRPDRAPEG